MRLFVDRARTALPGFELTAENGPAVAGICRRLDGMPLPIELAAARVAMLSPHQIDARLDDHLALLSADDRTASPRQRTLRAMVDWSHDLLPEAERLLFRRLAVFSGGFSLDAAEGICPGRGIDPVDVLELLTQLVDKSLVMVDHHPDRARYRMLESVRTYALERLGETPEEADVRAAHLRWFADLVERSEPELVGPGQDEAGRLLAAEIDNLRTAVEWSLAGGDVEAGLQLVGVRRLWQFAQSHLGEGRSWIERLLAAAVDPPLPLRANAVHAAGWIAWLQGDQEGARAYLEESLSIRRALGDARATGPSLYMLGLVEKDAGDYERARAHTVEALDLARSRGDRQQVADLLGQLGQIAYDQGNPEAARTLLEESAELAQDVGDKHGLADALRILGWIAHDAGDDTTAGRRFERALALQRDLEDRACSSITLMALGSLSGSHGDRRQALAFFGEALSLQRDLGQRARIADILWQLGAATAHSDPGAAARLFGASEALRKRLGVPLRKVYEQWYEREVSKLREALGQDVLTLGLDEGRALMWREAIEEALRLTSSAAES